MYGAESDLGQECQCWFLRISQKPDSMKDRFFNISDSQAYVFQVFPIGSSGQHLQHYAQTCLFEQLLSFSITLVCHKVTQVFKKELQSDGWNSHLRNILTLFVNQLCSWTNTTQPAFFLPISPFNYKSSPRPWSLPHHLFISRKQLLSQLSLLN